MTKALECMNTHYRKDQVYWSTLNFCILHVMYKFECSIEANLQQLLANINILIFSSLQGLTTVEGLPP